PAPADYAPVVQWIEWKFPKLLIQVRFLSGAPYKSTSYVNSFRLGRSCCGYSKEGVHFGFFASVGIAINPARIDLKEHFGVCMTHLTRDIRWVHSSMQAQGCIGVSSLACAT